MAFSKRISSEGPLTKALTSRMPAIFSRSTVFRRSRRCWIPRNNGSMRRMKKRRIPVVTARTGIIISASPEFVLVIRTRLPAIISGARVPMRRETWTRVFIEFTSLVRRVSSSEVFRRSRFPKEKDWIFSNNAARRSRAAPSPARMEKELFPRAKTVPSPEMPSITNAVSITIRWSWPKIPRSMILWTSLGIERSMRTSMDSRAKAARACFLYGLTNERSFRTSRIGTLREACLGCRSKGRLPL